MEPNSCVTARDNDDNSNKNPRYFEESNTPHHVHTGGYHYSQPVATNNNTTPGFISRASMFEEHFPDQIRNLKASEKDKRKIPNILYWKKYGDYKPIPICGPPVTQKEEYDSMIIRMNRKDERQYLSAVRKEIKAGKQKQIKSFFKKKKRSTKF